MILRKITNLGYTTINNDWDYLTNKELAKHDILTNFNIDKGECDWDPDFGTNIHKKMFDKKVERNKEEIVNDITKVIEDDPRVQLESINTVEEEKGWTFYCSISYLGGVPEDWIFFVNRKGKASIGYYPLKD